MKKTKFFLVTLMLFSTTQGFSQSADSDMNKSLIFENANLNQYLLDVQWILLIIKKL